jgi:hypothetical protein
MYHKTSSYFFFKRRKSKQKETKIKVKYATASYSSLREEKVSKKKLK